MEAEQPLSNKTFVGCVYGQLCLAYAGLQLINLENTGLQSRKLENTGLQSRKLENTGLCLCPNLYVTKGKVCSSYATFHKQISKQCTIAGAVSLSLGLDRKIHVNLRWS